MDRKKLGVMKSDDEEQIDAEVKLPTDSQDWGRTERCWGHGHGGRALE